MPRSVDRHSIKPHKNSSRGKVSDRRRADVRSFKGIADDDTNNSVSLSLCICICLSAFFPHCHGGNEKWGRW